MPSQMHRLSAQPNSPHGHNSEAFTFLYKQAHPTPFSHTNSIIFSVPKQRKNITSQSPRIKINGGLFKLCFEIHLFCESICSKITHLWRCAHQTITLVFQAGPKPMSPHKKYKPWQLLWDEEILLLQKPSCLD